MLLRDLYNCCVVLGSQKNINSAADVLRNLSKWAANEPLFFSFFASWAPEGPHGGPGGCQSGAQRRFGRYLGGLLEPSGPLWGAYAYPFGGIGPPLGRYFGSPGSFLVLLAILQSAIQAESPIPNHQSLIPSPPIPNPQSGTVAGRPKASGLVFQMVSRSFQDAFRISSK